MKRLASFVVLMVLGSSAHAASSFSFVVAGHRISVAAPRDCSSPSCVSVAIGGVYETRQRRARNEHVVIAPGPTSAKPATPVPQLTPIQAAITPIHPAVETQAVIEARAKAPQSPPLALSPPPALPIQAAAPAPAAAAPVAPPATPPVPAPSEVVAPAALAVPAVPAVSPVIEVLREAEEAPADWPLGDWRPEGSKGLVRIKSCGKALCGYVLDQKSNSTGESVLINMKPNTADTWSGSIYGRASSTTYYGTLAMQNKNSLRVEACALGRFFCSGGIWRRVITGPDELITSSRKTAEPKS
jgi:uncharacterized protein (DUF2147 family)